MFFLTCLPCPHVQVKASGEDSVKIPDHEVVTRRRQFRMKKERAEAKREKKAAKKVSDQEKKEQKIAKKAAKDEAKKAKELAKEQAKAAKAAKTAKPAKTAKESRKSKGRTAAEKTKERKTKKNGEKKRKCAQNTEKIGGVSRQAEDPPALESDEKPTDSRPEDVQVTLPDGDFQETIPEVGVHSRKMKRLRHLAASWKPTDIDSTAQTSMETPETPTSKPKKMAKMMQKECPREGHEDASTPKEAIKKKTKAGKAKKEQETDDAGKNTKSRSRKSSTSKEGKSKEIKSKGEKASKKKAAAKASQAQGRTRRPKVEPVDSVDEPSKALVLETLKECENSNCTHPSFVHPRREGGLSFSPYWTRNTVGVKVPRRFLENKKAKGQGPAQIAYFGHNSPCTYASWVAAGLYVSRWNF